MFCGKCGNRLESGQNTCPNCGASVEREFCGGFRDIIDQSHNDRKNRSNENKGLKSLKTGLLVCCVICLVSVCFSLFLLVRLNKVMQTNEELNNALKSYQIKNDTVVHKKTETDASDLEPLEEAEGNDRRTETDYISEESTVVQQEESESSDNVDDGQVTEPEDDQQITEQPQEDETGHDMEQEKVEENPERGSDMY